MDGKGDNCPTSWASQISHPALVRRGSARRLGSALVCENDMGVRFTHWPPGDTHRPSCPSAGAATSCGPTARVVRCKRGSAVAGATPGGGEDGDAHRDSPRRRSGHAEMGGRSQPRPRRPDRHRRSGHRGATASTATTCGIDIVYVRSAISVHKHPDVGCTLVDRHRERRKPPPIHGPTHRHRQAPATAVGPVADESTCGATPPPGPRVWRKRLLSASFRSRRSCSPSIEFAAGFIDAPDGKAEAKPEPLTLDKLFAICGEEVTPTKGAHSRGHDRAAMRMFLRFFGRSRDPATLTTSSS